MTERDTERQSKNKSKREPERERESARVGQSCRYCNRRAAKGVVCVGHLRALLLAPDRRQAHEEVTATSHTLSRSSKEDVHMLWTTSPLCVARNY